jgi:hypothetical protein
MLHLNAFSKQTLLYPKDGGGKVCQNIDTYLQNNWDQDPEYCNPNI